MCPQLPSCQSKLHQVARQRRRLEIIVWQRCYDNLISAFSTPIATCAHANIFYFMVHWINLTFFYSILDTPQRKQPCLPNSKLCLAQYTERTRRFVTSFKSFAAPILTMHRAHLKSLEDIAQCCKLPVDANWHICVVDLSALIFKSLNETYYDNMLRIRSSTTPQHITRSARGETKQRLNTVFFDAWVAKLEQRVQHMLSTNLMFCQSLFTFPIPHPLPLHDSTKQDYDEIDVQFLDGLLQ